MKLYAVRNKDGKYFRSIGYGGYGSGKSSWVDELEKAKFYTKVGQAASRVTFFFKNYPAYGCPEILVFEIDAENAVVCDMLQATQKKLAKAKEKELKRQSAEKDREIQRLYIQQEEIKKKLKTYES